MTMLGHGDLPSRIKSALRGVLHPPHTHDTPSDLRVIGHRGAGWHAPENTRRSFQCAIDRGATALETDVCRTRDGRFVLWHDADPRETITVARAIGQRSAYYANEPAVGTSCRKPISEITYEEFLANFGYSKKHDPLSQVIDGNTKPEVQPEPVEALLDFAANEPRLLDVFVDIKLRADELDAARELARVIETSNERARTPTRFHLLTTEVEVLEVLREATLELKVYGDFELPGVLDVAKQLGLRDISMGMGQRIWPSFYREVCDVIEARKRGELDSVIVWTINEEDRLRALVEAGVNGIMTDDTELLCRVLREVR